LQRLKRAITKAKHTLGTCRVDTTCYEKPFCCINILIYIAEGFFIAFPIEIPSPHNNNSFAMLHHPITCTCIHDCANRAILAPMGVHVVDVCIHGGGGNLGYDYIHNPPHNIWGVTQL
jgi:hypothetical protein